MANVSLPDCEDGRTDRGQLLLVTGLMIALTLVMLAILLNSVIYAENLGTRGSDIGGDAAIDFEQSAHEATAEIVRATNRDVESTGVHDDLEAQFNSSHSDWHAQSTRHLVRDGRYSGLSVADIDAGSQIRQTEERPFTNASGHSDWTVAEASAVRDYQLTITHVDDSSAEFQLVVVGADGDDWALTVSTDGSGTTELRTARHADPVACDVDDQPVVIDFHTATVNDGHCDGLVFAPGLEAPYETVRYENGDRIDGTYQLTVNNTAVERSSHFNSVDSPSVASGLYSVTVALAYETDRIDYESVATVTPRANHE